jgi:subtilase family serine protease
MANSNDGLLYVFSIFPCSVSAPADDPTATGGSPPFIPDLLTPTDTNEPYNVWLNYILAQDNVPQVISTSYGDDEQTVPESYARRACHGFAQLGARGVSVLFSSGDFGVGSNGTCFSNTNPDQRKFLPAFPAGCPWVTTVGGTKSTSFCPTLRMVRLTWRCLRLRTRSRSVSSQSY